MSNIEKTNEIDAIGIDRDTGIVVLKIFDHLNWENEQYHLYLLQEKINSYLRFMESKEIFDIYPDAKNRKLNISISFKEKPSANGIKFLDVVSNIISNAGFLLTYSIVNV